MRTRTEDIRRVCDTEDTHVSAQVVPALITGGHAVRLVCNDDAWPNQTANFHPRGARLLARHLLELADEAELLNLEGEDVEMACTVCAKQVRRTFGAATWQHREPGDALACTATGPLKARVAAGA